MEIETQVLPILGSGLDETGNWSGKDIAWEQEVLGLNSISILQLLGNLGPMN